MPLVPIARPRPGTRRLRAALRILPGPRAAVWPLVVAWAAICAMLAFLPGWWLTDWKDLTLNQWFAATHTQAARLTQEWEHWTLRFPDFTTGTEPALRTWLAREALVTAVVDSDSGRVWLRDGDRLRAPVNPEESREPADWARRALELAPIEPYSSPAASRRARSVDLGAWWLVGTLDPQSRKRCSIVAFYGKWCLIKIWVPGSPEVERWLQGTLKPGAPYRFGVVSGFQNAADLERPRSISSFRRHCPGDSPERLQYACPDTAPFRVDKELSHSFGGMWHVVLQMSPEAYRTFWKAYTLRRLMAWTSYALVVAASGLAVALVLFARSRERLLADRLASLTHSLKTPLAVLKLRCDTALNLDLPRETQEARLLEIRGEVDHLVRTIEGGLEEMRSRYSGRVQDRVDAAFFEQLDEDLTPAFEERSRPLEVYGGEVTLRCSASVLRAALDTLVENALVHGRGRVVVKASRLEGRVRVEVSDEGDGMDPAILEGLRRRAPAGPAPRTGEGMGLLVLAQVARQEGWGLAFGREEAGFTARLELPD
ncbi:sensor histidine kinase KdpD [Geothrix sp. 21YS21S-2]|uniref:sensor histidine kinase n=1 Tax=Geothrix sp. 21YS21S-2 TaxID=3068893 RepID=UPI0027B90223|nr:HAMP domain-containing sensor histidine kinase [Geothrix sp. 21YS21S-2]